MKFLRDAWPIVVIVGTIAGAAWTAAWSVRDFMAAQIAASESRLTAQIVATETRLTAQIATTDNRLTAQIAATDNRLTTLDNRFTAQIADSETRLTGQLAELRMLFVDHLEDHANAR
jgi:hypothetical protein